MLFVDWWLEDVPRLRRLKLIQVTKDKDGDTAKNCVHHSDLSQSEVQVVEEVCRDHRDLVHNDTPEVPEE